MNLDFSVLFGLEGLFYLVVLSLLEIVLGIDNIIFISIVTEKLPAEKKRYARNLGLSLALIVRLVLLSVVSWIMGSIAVGSGDGLHDFPQRGHALPSLSDFRNQGSRGQCALLDAAAFVSVGIRRLRLCRFKHSQGSHELWHGRIGENLGFQKTMRRQDRYDQ